MAWTLSEIQSQKSIDTVTRICWWNKFTFFFLPSKIMKKRKKSAPFNPNIRTNNWNSAEGQIFTSSKNKWTTNYLTFTPPRLYSHSRHLLTFFLRIQFERFPFFSSTTDWKRRDRSVYQSQKWLPGLKRWNWMRSGSGMWRPLGYPAWLIALQAYRNSAAPLRWKIDKGCHVREKVCNRDARRERELQKAILITLTVLWICNIPLSFLYLSKDPSQKITL